MIKIEWIEIATGEFITGLSNEQKEILRSKLWDEYGVAKMDAVTQQAIKSLAIKYRKGRPKDIDLSVEEQQVKPSAEDWHSWFFEAEHWLEQVPLQQRRHLPTFYIAQFPITHAQFEEFLISDYAQFSGLNKRYSYRSIDLSTMPEDMEWGTANGMAQWLGGRLPTALEWEKAGSGAEGFLYPWGNEWNPSFGNFQSKYRPRYSQEKGIWRSVVDAYPEGVSPYGVWDMVGNMSEYIDQPGASKGWSAKGIPAPFWFWSIIPLAGEGNNAGLRPVLDNWSKQTWTGFTSTQILEGKK